MVSLSDRNKSRCRVHLGYVLDAVPDGDAWVLEDRMSNLRDRYEANWINRLLNECDTAWKRQFIDDQRTGIARITNITGDINRTETVNIAESKKVREKAYKETVLLLGQQLAVPVYRYVGGARLSTVIQRRRSLPRGPADTSRTDKIYMSRNYA